MFVLILQLPLSSLVVAEQMKEMGGACSTYGGEERCIQDFCGETLGKEATWKIQK